MSGTDNMKSAKYDFSRTMTSQLVALWIDSGDSQFKEEYLRRLSMCGLDVQTAKEMLDYETWILSTYPRPEMMYPEFIALRVFGLRERFLPEHYSYYKDHFEYPLSYIVKASDEAEWHFWNSHEKNLSDEVWEEIYYLADKNRKLFEPFAIDLIENHGWTVSNVNQFSYNEQAMLDYHRWNRTTTAAAKDPWDIGRLGIQYIEKQVKKPKPVPEPKQEEPAVASYSIESISSDRLASAGAHICKDEDSGICRVRIPLDSEGKWKLSVFFDKNENICKYSLDSDGAADERYVFTDEAAVGAKLLREGDGRLYLDELLRRYISEEGDSGLLTQIPVTAQFIFR